MNLPRSAASDCRGARPGPVVPHDAPIRGGDEVEPLEDWLGTADDAPARRARCSIRGT